MSKKKCEHIAARFEQIRLGQRIFVLGSYAVFGGKDPQFGYGETRTIVGALCAECNTRLPLGPSNDAGSNVQEEIEAAGWAMRASLTLSGMVRLGWECHHSDVGPSHMVGISWRAGWLARELATHDDREQRDADAWPWDPTRPVAGQYEEYVALQARPSPTTDAPPADPAIEVGGGAHSTSGPSLGDVFMRRTAAMVQITSDDLRTRIGDRPAGWGRDLDAIEYEHQRRAEPDCRDEDGPEVERLMADAVADLDAEPPPLGFDNMVANQILDEERSDGG